MITFLIPDESPALTQWTSGSCEIQPDNGKFLIVDTNINTNVASADTESEAYEWLYGTPLDNPEVIEGNWGKTWGDNQRASEKIETVICPKCYAGMKPSQALENTFVTGNGIPAHLAGDGQTVSQTGPAVMVDCLKCLACGHSIRELAQF